MEGMEVELTKFYIKIHVGFFFNKEFLIFTCTISNSICKMFWISAIREQLEKSKMMAHFSYLHLVNFNQVRI